MNLREPGEDLDITREDLHSLRTDLHSPGEYLHSLRKYFFCRAGWIFLRANGLYSPQDRKKHLHGAKIPLARSKFLLLKLAPQLHETKFVLHDAALQVLRPK